MVVFRYTLDGTERYKFMGAPLIPPAPIQMSGQESLIRVVSADPEPGNRIAIENTQGAESTSNADGPHSFLFIAALEV